MTVDPLLIDGHKLAFHPREVSRWLDGELTYPLYVEVSPSGQCNHRCIFCGLDWMGYPKRFLDVQRVGAVFYEMHGAGVKSVMFGGEGEPMLHPEFGNLVSTAFDAGLDIGLTTNGTMLTEKFIKGHLEQLTWVKVSIDAGTAETYKRIHRANDFGKVMDNLKRCCDHAIFTTVGAQAILLPDNADDLGELAYRVREAGAEYLVVKPFSQHPKSERKEFGTVPVQHVAKKLSVYDTDTFKVIVRANAMSRVEEGCKPYAVCYGCNFWAYLDSGGTLWNCSARFDEEFKLGNIYENSFKVLWKQGRRSYRTEGCRVNCRMDAANRYLWDLKNPHSHANFI